MIRSRSTLLAVLLLGTAPAACADPLTNPLIEPGPLPVSVTPVALRPENPGLTQAGQLTYTGGFVLRGEGAGLGGLSALTLGADGESFVAMSDIGFWVAGRLRFDEAGELVGVDDLSADKLLDQAGLPVNLSLRDAEAMVADGPDHFVIAFEREHRLWRYPRDARGVPFALPTPLTTPPGLLEAERNEGLEALARLEDGRWIAFAQDLASEEGRLGWIGSGSGTDIAWQPFRYAAADGFDVSDAAALPGGDLIVLERSFTPFGGFDARVVHVEARRLLPDTVVVGEALASLGAPMSVDNFEAIAVAALAGGGVRIVLASDDNFRPFQRTLLLTFRWGGA